MKKLLILLIVMPLFLGAQQTINSSIHHDGLVRTYIIYIPASYSSDTAVPLVFNFHGYGSNSYAQMNYGDLRPVADTAGFIIVHPQGTLLNGISHWNVGGWTIGSTADDIGFVDALIDSLSAEYNIDTDRVYSTGMSNGGFMSFLLACQLGDRIAAIAPVAGSMTPETYDECMPEHPTPILQFHGTADDVVPYDGVVWSKPVQEALDYWVAYNNCYPLPTIIQMPDIDPDDGSTVEHIIYPSGDNGVNAEHFKVYGGTHKWPGAAYGGAGTNHDIDASAEIWKFFLKYDINGAILPTGVNNKKGDSQLSIFPNPAKDFISLKGELKDMEIYVIFNVNGKKEKIGPLSPDDDQINISSLDEGIYLLKINGKTQKFLIWR